MPTEIQLANRKQWLEALRSGNYSQANCWLKINGTYCCLGVDAELGGALVERSYSGQDGIFGVKDEHDNINTCYPNVDWFMERHGLPTREVARHLSRCAASWNDGYNKSFAAIADNLEAAFKLADDGGYDPSALSYDHFFAADTAPTPSGAAAQAEGV